MFDGKTPDQIYSILFEAVQSTHVFADSKTFVDATPRFDPDDIVRSFIENRQKANFDLGSFVTSNFELPAADDKQLQPDTSQPVRKHIELLWDALTRSADKQDRYSSLLALPNRYVVPGGRFREIYYWDSYFTMLGLAASNRVELVENMVSNFAFLIDQVGFIPNGNRSYYCTRSQLPVFALMVELLAQLKNDEGVYATYLAQLVKEYQFWMSGASDGDTVATDRVITVNGGHLNRYWDNSDQPRQESYAEDLALAAAADRDAPQLYRDVRAACESGWDFSSRWLEDHQQMTTIRTTRIVPVDLNTMMYKLESVLAHACNLVKNNKQSAHYRQRADTRKTLIQDLFFDDESGFFVDLVLPEMTSSKSHSLAAAFPLFLGLATPNQALQVADRIHTQYLKSGGWVTSLIKSGQQWDSPNGWAPLQWIVYDGLKKYGFTSEAREGAQQWVQNNLRVFRNSGKLLEKYNVEDIGMIAEGGEYAVQDGFGWTNAVLLCMLNELDIEQA